MSWRLNDTNCRIEPVLKLEETGPVPPDRPFENYWQRQIRKLSQYSASVLSV